MRGIFFLLFSMLVLSGCNTLAPEVRKSLATEGGAVVAFSQDKKIFYNKATYAFVTIVENYSKSDFSGIWNPDRDIEAAFIEAHNRDKDRKGLTSAVGLVGAPSVDKYIASEIEWYIKNSQGTSPSSAGALLPPKQELFMAVPSHASYAALSAALKKKGIRYLYEVRELGPFVTKIGAMILQTPLVVRIIDIQDNKVIWYGEEQRGSEILGLGGDFKELEGARFGELKTRVSKATGKGAMMLMGRLR